MSSVERQRQCRAFHGQRVNLQCQEMIPEGAYHEDHWAIDADGHTVRWTDIVAIYPEIDSPLYTAAVREELADVPVPVSERQVGGDHYRRYKIQPWDVIDEYGLGFYAGNALKYLLRAGNKGPMVEDLRKCRHYIDKLIEKVEEEG